MKTDKEMPRVWFWAAPAAVVLALIAAIVVSSANSARDDIPVLGQVPEFRFTERSGQPYGLSDMRGSLTVVDFIFTNCQTVCPMMAVAMSDLYELYAGSDKVKFVSISVDPARDTLATLREYAEHVGVDDNRWLFLRAPLDDVVKLMEGGFKLAAENLPMGHPSHFILVDDEGGIRGYYSHDDDADQELLRQHLRILARSRL